MHLLNRLITEVLPIVPKRLVWTVSSRYIAGDTVDDAIEASQALNDGGMRVTLDILGEFITRLDEAEKNRDEYLALIDQVEGEGINGNYSLKPTMFGLLIDKDVCFRHIHAVVEKAAAHGNFVWIDMEDSTCVDLEIELYRRLKPEFVGHVGMVLQAYLRRTRDDIDRVLDLHSSAAPLSIRLCKGIYKEAPAIAFQEHATINAHYLEDLAVLLGHGVFTGIATHDRPLIEGAYARLAEQRVPAGRYEFQMLYGVTPELRREIVAAGHPMRIYVPFGRHWFGYATRRLKENPDIAGHVLRSLLFGE